MSIATSAPLPTLLLAAVAAVALAGCGVSVDIGGADDGTRRTVTDEVPIGDLRRVEVSTENGAVEVRGSDNVDAVEVVAIFRERSDGDGEHEVSVDGDTLRVSGECDGGWWHGCSVGFVVTVPADFDVEVDTDNGRVDVAAMDGAVEIETDNGAIDAVRLTSTSVDARTDNGRIVLSFDTAPGDVMAQTDNGAIAVRVPDASDGYDVEAASDNGRVEVDVVDDPGAERRIVASSDNGSIDIEPVGR